MVADDQNLTIEALKLSLDHANSNKNTEYFTDERHAVNRARELINLEAEEEAGSLLPISVLRLNLIMPSKMVSRFSTK